jgi:N-acetylglucosaminyldiphosphoundecaprenol N-acetyl-beta-D-mannosaminyltransferase
MKLIFNTILFYQPRLSLFDLNLKPGLYTFPAAVNLSNLEHNPIYHQSLIHSDFVFFDSGYFVLLLRLFKGIKVKKFSGYKFITLFINYLQSKNKYTLFVIEPSRDISKVNRIFFDKNNIKILSQFIAPFYKKRTEIIDYELLDILNKIRPNYILINLGGETQEILGYYLKKNLNYKPVIICTGAALSFLTEQQAPLTNWIDRMYLGWLWRCIYNPKVFIPRYLSAFKLIKLVIQSKVKIID